MQIFPARAKVTRAARSAWVQGLVILTSITLITLAWPTVAQAQTSLLVDDPAQLEAGEVLRVEEGEVRQLAASPDEATLAIATSAGLWIYGPSETSNGQLLAATAVQALWWSPDGNLLAALQEDGSIQLWQMATLTTSVTLTSPAPIVSLTWAPDSSQLATGSTTGLIELWQISNGERLETFEGHNDRISALYWFRDGAQLISAAADGSVRAWQIEVAAPAAPTPMPTPRPPITASVQTDVLNVRSGPATSFERLGNVKRGESVTVLGQSNQCAWFQVRTVSGLEGWMNGNPQFITLNGTCADLTSSPVTATTSPTQTLPAVAQPTSTPTPPSALQVATPTLAAALPTATPADEDPFPPNKGCFLFQNQLGPELTVTVTAEEGNFTETIKVAESQEVPYCLDPGRYSYTIDAPPPWADINGDLDVKAGDRYMFPIRAQ